MEAFKNLSPTAKSKSLVAVGVGAVIIFFLGVAEITKPENVEEVRTADDINIIATEDTRSLGMDAVASKTLALEKKLKELEEENLKLTKDFESLEKRAALVSDLEDGISTLENRDKKIQGQLGNELDRATKELRAYFENLIAQSPSLEEEVKKQRAMDAQKNNNANNVPSNNSGVGRYPSSSDNLGFSYGQNEADKKADPFISNGSVDNRDSGLIKVVEATHEEKDESVELAVEQEKQIYLPQGAILTGVLLTGMDAPTSDSAKQTPYPVLVRLKKEAILPNYRVMQEVNECFALLGGYGDLSSERVMFRGEAISCIKHDGSVIEEKLSGYAVGEDAKAGLRGRVVTRNSRVLVNAMLSGFASGLSSAFNVNPVPVIADSSDGTQQYQDVFDSSAVQGGLAKGASSAMEKLADFYMSAAERIFPVIEVNSGRVLNIVLTKGNNL